MLDLAVLGLLKEKPMYGYELNKALAERLGHARKFSYGSLYPTLKALAKQGAVEMEHPKGETSRRKNVYRITPHGEELFDQLLEQSGTTQTEDREAFMLRLAFFRYTRPETRRRLLERRRGYLVEKLEQISESLKTLRERMDAYSLELMTHSATETERDIHWLDTMIEAERNA
ncbi:MAG TPA: PadR family transcriptional regulator [Actinomycetota bacterium]|nr:PadR family transcriptional regulator [Actinomycetota bacterium]